MSKPCLRLIVFATLLGLFGLAHGQSAGDHEDDEPTAYDGRQICDEGPEAPLERHQRSLLRAALDRDYTYVRCWYRKNASDLDPQSGYEWARTEQGGYYKLPGYWYGSFAFEWRNMFYTTVARAELERICQDTLRQRNRPAALFDLHAADNRLSFNYLIWTNGEKDGGTSIDRIVSFGDSLSDTMNLYNGSLWKMPHRKSWLLGRFSNGPLWNEEAAARLGLPLYNWSIGGAAGDSHLVIPGLREQVASWTQYMRSARNYQPARTLFTLWIGANDLINYDRSAESVAQHVEASLSALIAQGAKHLLVLNLPDLTLAPGLRTSSKKATVAKDVASYNQELSLNRRSPAEKACRRAPGPDGQHAAARRSGRQPRGLRPRQLQRLPAGRLRQRLGLCQQAKPASGMHARRGLLLLGRAASDGERPTDSRRESHCILARKIP